MEVHTSDAMTRAEGGRLVAAKKRAAMNNGTPSKKRGAAKRSKRPPPPSRRMYMTFYARLAALLLVSLVIVVILISVFPVLAFHRKRWRLLIDHMQALWVNTFLWLLPPTFLEVHGELPDASLRPKVIIANHATEVDWLYLWMLARMTSMGRCDRSGSVKIMLKEAVKYIPVCGWGCALFDFIFLARKWEVDKKRIEDRLVQFCKDEAPLWIFLFVEGSTVTTRGVEKSRAWARKTGRPEFEQLLLPRTRGLDHVLEILSANSPHPPEVFDMTMAFEGYSGEVPTWEDGFSRKVDHLVPNFSKMMLGTSAKRCYIDSRRFCYAQLKAEHPATLERWLDERWVRKERLLRDFADVGHFDASECGDAVTVPITASIWRSLLTVAFYICMWAGMVFTYAKYSTDGYGFFKLDHEALLTSFRH